MARKKRPAWAQALLSRLFTGYVTFVHRTTRWSYVGSEILEDDIRAGRSRVICTWHSRLGLVTYNRDWSGGGLSVLASYHQDAQILTKGLERRGIRTIELLTTGDNTAAVKEAVRAIRKGQVLGVTPDGPLGPREYVKPGALTIAALAQVPICAQAYSVSRWIRVKTWDRFIIPLPFGRGVFVMSEGFVPPRRLDDATLEELRQRLEDDINAVTAEADRIIRGG